MTFSNAEISRSLDSSFSFKSSTISSLELRVTLFLLWPQSSASPRNMKSSSLISRASSVDITEKTVLECFDSESMM
eukprot:CAMPEP_0203736306 /NCGR_PEP_ID=MMETSP0092-20131115/35370_1 /ASSEMBLY_ACC=CAM_ASM_001090 /TAXON_ID=426623 /ORGANISM="Chaetoceros affinis, Strain CCMP159" /LENGTH=75 /DNA_ID=CAMNT_0050621185 /DNA_START=213 /DNA_END=440 /DNA_ORIENTATION=+